jgi:hypothetical protein
MRKSLTTSPSLTERSEALEAANKLDMLSKEVKAVAQAIELQLTKLNTVIEAKDISKHVSEDLMESLVEVRQRTFEAVQTAHESAKNVEVERLTAKYPRVGPPFTAIVDHALTTLSSPPQYLQFQSPDLPRSSASAPMTPNCTHFPWPLSHQSMAMSCHDLSLDGRAHMKCGKRYWT